MAVRDSSPAPPSTNRNNEKIFVTREDVLQKESLFSSPFRDRTAALLQLDESAQWTMVKGLRWPQFYK